MTNYRILSQFTYLFTCDSKDCCLCRKMPLFRKNYWKNL